MLPFPSPKVSFQEGNPNSPAGAFSLSHTQSKQKGPAALVAQPDRPTEPPRAEGASGTLVFLPPEFLGVTQICCSHSFIDVLPFPWQHGALIGE